MKKYDYLIVGAGLFGAVFAHEATRRGKTCLVIDKRGHIGGNIYTEEVEGIVFLFYYFPVTLSNTSVISLDGAFVARLKIMIITRLTAKPTARE